jgi:glycosyltransferase involved in cell wall biosynthesis
MDKVIWLSWERHRRSEQLAKYLGVKSYFFKSELPRLVRHPIFIIKTIKVLFIESPRVLIVQNPSIILAFLVCLINKLKLLKYYLVVDSHNGGIMPDNHKNKLNWIYRFVQRIADITIVTNDKLAEVIRQNGGNPFILPDKIPEPTEVNDIYLPEDFKYLFVCTFAKDEPIEELMIAAGSLDINDKIYVTGNYKKADPNLLKGLNSSIIITGYLADSDYWGHMKSVDCVVDLTLRDDCLVCGAYEAVSVGTPLILSDTEVLRKTFRKGAVFTKNNAVSISSALKEAKENNKILKDDIKKFRDEFIQEWQIYGDRLKQRIKQVAENGRN